MLVDGVVINCVCKTILEVASFFHEIVSSGYGKFNSIAKRREAKKKTTPTKQTNNQPSLKLMYCAFWATVFNDIIAIISYRLHKIAHNAEFRLSRLHRHFKEFHICFVLIRSSPIHFNSLHLCFNCASSDRQGRQSNANTISPVLCKWIQK